MSTMMFFQLAESTLRSHINHCATTVLMALCNGNIWNAMHDTR